MEKISDSGSGDERSVNEEDRWLFVRKEGPIGVKGSFVDVTRVESVIRFSLVRIEFIERVESTKQLHFLPFLNFLSSYFLLCSHFVLILQLFTCWFLVNRRKVEWMSHYTEKPCDLSKVVELLLILTILGSQSKKTKCEMCSL